MIEKKLVPNRRFEGYTNLWEAQKLGFLYQKVRNAFVGTATPYYVKHGNFYLQSNNVKNGQINRITEVFINDEFHKKQKDKLLHTGDLVMVQSGHVGHTAVITEEFDGIAAHALIMFQDAHEKVNSHFINFQFQTNNVKGKLKNITTGNTIRHILASDMAGFELKVTDINEQQKIGNFFKHLDQMITLEQHKLEKTKALKSAYLTEMFPSKGERVPKRRIVGFMDKWEECNLSELGEFKSNGVNKKIDNKDKPVSLLNYMDVYSRIKLNSSNVNKLMQVTAKDKEILENNVEINDVFFTPSSETADDIGRVMVIEETLPNTVYSYHLMRFRPYKNIFYSIYPNYAFATEYVRNQMVLSAQGVQRFVLNRKAFEEIKIVLPSYREQKKISEFFKLLDDKIVNHQRKLDKLKAIKQAYLQEMFV